MNPAFALRPSPFDEWVFVALGSNLGDSPRIIRQAMARLQALADRPIHKSSLWQTVPVNCPPGSPLFVNAVAGLFPRAGETPESLLAQLQALEKEFGRMQKKVRNEPRTLDLDLIAFGQQTRNTPTFALPHPRASGRGFVLQPLAEIAPDLILPGQEKTIAELLAQFQSAELLTCLGGA